MNSKVSVTELFSRDEIKELTTTSDLHGAWAVGSTWTVIVMTFGTVAYSWEYLPTWGKVLMCALALAILAGRQLAMAILMHDASHHSLFKTKWLNTHLTDWLCARPIWNDVSKYRPYHLKHHAKTSQPDDPDLGLVKNFPITQSSLFRKFFRDLNGQSGLKFLAGRVLMDLELLEWSVSNDPKPIPRDDRSNLELAKNLLKNSSGMLISNAAIFSALWASGHPKLYLLWPLAYITPFPLFIRIRAMAEHAGLETSHSALSNTRTTRAGWLARALVAPIHVNYHIEHHLMASVPHQKLGRMHQMLREREYVDAPPSYLDVIRSLLKK
ncbi:fatty acid desaturase family protein [Acinetobacter lwoffii]|uniref:Fatty acid desaturase family protein n=1 Tax=Acinetobacter lwoffii TaxID=28090 RepID=A0AAJ3E225_ACILW|nr:fatty acid desaturase family protein [Acinetobacter lwoffii]EEY89969.1 stearoyl-CoA 9-desaturase [Acinetobacter lwoffii SH145]MCJ8513177.1 fatty acid desaturase family protein [Acinetobacter lwoffii]MCO8084588.1 fatty acid desaturase family protein [Acinetobacter lwoffii]MCU4615520.1 fatty acid desaturase family protein [Acinetobacter lwoffii]NKS45393.1 fatty acid desaturase family protein [Acinetobacter lwoffii]